MKDISIITALSGFEYTGQVLLIILELLPAEEAYSKYTGKSFQQFLLFAPLFPEFLFSPNNQIQYRAYKGYKNYNYGPYNFVIVPEAALKQINKGYKSENQNSKRQKKGKCYKKPGEKKINHNCIFLITNQLHAFGVLK